MNKMTKLSDFEAWIIKLGLRAGTRQERIRKTKFILARQYDREFDQGAIQPSLHTEQSVTDPSQAFHGQAGGVLAFAPYLHTVC